MADSKVTCLETYKAARMAPVRFNTVAQLDRKVVIDIKGEFSTAAARMYAEAILQRCDAVDFDNDKNPKADR